MNARRVLIGLVLTLVVGCQGAPAPEATAPAADAPLATPGLTLAAPEPYVLGDGSVDYPALRRDYGEPNRNVILNPRATDVARTVSRAQVKVFPNKLVFPASAVWAARRAVGDTLYCDTACGTPFLRNVTAIQRDGDSIVLATVDGKVTDVIHHGWVHSEVPVELEVPRFDQNITHAVSNDDGKGGTETNGDKKEKALTGKLSGKVGATISFKTTVTTDLVIDWGGISWSKGIELPKLVLFKLIVTGGPAIDLIAQITAEGAYKPPSWEFFSASWPLGAIPVGPISIIPTLTISATGSAEAEGKVQVTASAHASVALTAGVTYNERQSWDAVQNLTETKRANFNITGEASARAGVELAIGLRFSIAGLGGPDITLTGEVGVEASANYSSNVGTDGKKCAASIDANAYFILAGKIGAQACIPVIDKCYPDPEKFFTIAQKKWTFPDPVWHYDVPAAKLRMCLADSDCEAPLKKCAKGCVDLTKDPANCGACGRVCAYQTNDPNSTCVNSVCSCKCTDGTACPNGKDTTGCSCPAGQKNCGSGCQNVTNDKLNCGACGHKCVDATGYANSVCSGGSCTCKCADGSACPGGTTASCAPPCLCADGKTACPNGDRNACPCPRGKQDCGSGCQDITNDAMNCGGCNNICSDITEDNGSICLDSNCTCRCDDGTACPGSSKSSCSNTCTCDDGTPCPATGRTGCHCPAGKADCGYGQGCQDVLSDALNCGGCGQACVEETGDPNSRCVAGRCTCTCGDGSDCSDFGSTILGCTCPDGQRDCGSGCIPITNDPKNCGGCSQSCWQETGDPRASCSGGVCGCKCPDGSKCPGLHTGTCCLCPNGSSCPNGDIAKCCSGGTSWCGSWCIDLQKDKNNCGKCGHDCASYTGVNDSVCVSGKCTCKCGDGTTCPDGTWWSCPK